MTKAAHRRAGVLVVGALGAGVVLADLGRFADGIPAFGWANTALVWVFAHQLGNAWRDGDLRPLRRRWALAVGGLTARWCLTSLGPYPRSLVAVEGAARSHLYPTTAGVAALAVLQTGVAVLLTAPLSRWLDRRRPWKAVVAVNSVILTAFMWHMTALLIVILGVEAAGGALLAEPTVPWWVATAGVAGGSRCRAGAAAGGLCPLRAATTATPPLRRVAPTGPADVARPQAASRTAVASPDDIARLAGRAGLPRGQAGRQGPPTLPSHRRSP